MSMYKDAIGHFKKSDPILYKASLKIEVQEISLPVDYFLRLTRTIIGQQLSVKAASTIFSRFEKLFLDGKISPEKILQINKDKMRKCGISYPKISYLKDLSQKVINNDLDLNKINDLDNETVTKNLTMVKGIGPWSAEMFLMFSLGRVDIFSIGDMGLKNAIKKLYELENTTDEEIIKISEKWSPYRTYACMILWKSLDNKLK